MNKPNHSLLLTLAILSLMLILTVMNVYHNSKLNFHSSNNYISKESESLDSSLMKSSIEKMNLTGLNKDSNSLDIFKLEDFIKINGKTLILYISEDHCINCILALVETLKNNLNTIREIENFILIGEFDSYSILNNWQKKINLNISVFLINSNLFKNGIAHINKPLFFLIDNEHRVSNSHLFFEENTQRTTYYLKNLKENELN